MSISGQYGIAYDAPLTSRLEFIRRTYLHLVGAVGVFVVLSYLFYVGGTGEKIMNLIAGQRYAWLLILGAFMLVGWLASFLAASNWGTGAQYMGLLVYTLGEALILSPLIWLAAQYYPGVLPTATGLTMLTFGGLSVYVLTTKKDFSFLGPALFIGVLVALGLIVAGVVFGFNLGIWFSAAMILFAVGAILYTTSKILHEYGTNQYVAAALALFAAVALLFWYVLQLLMQLRR